MSTKLSTEKKLLSKKEEEVKTLLLNTVQDILLHYLTKQQVFEEKIEFIIPINDKLFKVIMKNTKPELRITEVDRYKTPVLTASARSDGTVAKRIKYSYIDYLKHLLDNKSKYVEKILEKNLIKQIPLFSYYSKEQPYHYLRTLSEYYSKWYEQVLKPHRDMYINMYIYGYEPPRVINKLRTLYKLLKEIEPEKLLTNIRKLVMKHRIEYHIIIEIKQDSEEYKFTHKVHITDEETPYSSISIAVSLDTTTDTIPSRATGLFYTTRFTIPYGAVYETYIVVIPKILEAKHIDNLEKSIDKLRVVNELIDKFMDSFRKYFNEYKMKYRYKTLTQSRIHEILSELNKEKQVDRELSRTILDTVKKQSKEIDVKIEILKEEKNFRHQFTLHLFLNFVKEMRGTHVIVAKYNGLESPIGGSMYIYDPSNSVIRREQVEETVSEPIISETTYMVLGYRYAFRKAFEDLVSEISKCLRELLS